MRKGKKTFIKKQKANNNCSLIFVSIKFSPNFFICLQKKFQSIIYNLIYISF